MAALRTELLRLRSEKPIDNLKELIFDHVILASVHRSLVKVGLENMVRWGIG